MTPRQLYTICFLLLNSCCQPSLQAQQQSGSAARADSVRVPASRQYGSAHLIRRMFTGANYRDVWATPVRMPVFHIDTYQGGCRITKLGGGQQTKSIHLKDASGQKWKMRTVDKEVSGALTPFLRKTPALALTQDQISAAFPYAPLVTSVMAQGLGLPEAPAWLYYVPDDPGFGEHRELFAHQVCLIYREVDLPGDPDKLDTDELREAMAKNAGLQIDQRALLRARLFDMLIADWDRHDGQWEWAPVDSAGITWYRPVPEDRDQAFFKTGGLIPEFVSLAAMPQLQGFTPEGRNLQKVNHKMHGFDRQFLASLDRDHWQQAIRWMQQTLTDSLISRAMQRLPPEIYALKGGFLSERLRQRRDALMEHGLAYYDYLASFATVPVTSEPEVYEIREAEDGSMGVTVRRKTDGKEVFDRTFQPGETVKVRIEGLQPQDEVDQKLSGSGRIKLELIRM